MKRIIAILLLGALFVLAFSACKKHECTFADTWTYDSESHWHKATCEHTDKKADVEEHSFDASGLCVCGAQDIQIFVKAINDANPMSATMTLAESTQLDGIVLNGMYNVSYPGDGTARVIYEMDQFDEDFTSEEPIIKVEGIVTVNADGTVSGQSGLNRGVHIAVLLNIDLTNPNLDIVLSKNNARFTVAAADTAAVLGVAIDSDVTVGVTVVSGKVISIDISYANTVVTALYS